MKDWLTPIVLLAETERFRNFSATFRGERSDPELNGFLLIVAGIGALLAVSWIAARLWPKDERPRRINNPRGLFKALCRAHELDWSSRRLLWKLAQRHHPEHPAIVFTAPEALEARLAATKNSRRSADYRRLRERLFGEAGMALSPRRAEGDRE